MFVAKALVRKGGLHRIRGRAAEDGDFLDDERKNFKVLVV